MDLGDGDIAVVVVVVVGVFAVMASMWCIVKRSKLNKTIIFVLKKLHQISTFTVSPVTKKRGGKKAKKVLGFFIK